MSQLSAKVKEEIAAILPPTVFFFIALHIIAFIRVLMLKNTGITLETTASVALSALILGKAVLVADLLPFINRYPERPLIYNVAWKTMIYALLATCFHYLERLFDVWRTVSGLIAANDKLLSEIVWPHFWAIQILLLILILMYCLMRELVRVMGRDQVMGMLFGPVPKPFKG